MRRFSWIFVKMGYLYIYVCSLWARTVKRLRSGRSRRKIRVGRREAPEHAVPRGFARFRECAEGAPESINRNTSTNHVVFTRNQTVPTVNYNQYYVVGFNRRKISNENETKKNVTRNAVNTRVV